MNTSEFEQLCMWPDDTARSTVLQTTQPRLQFVLEADEHGALTVVDLSEEAVTWIGASSRSECIGLPAGALDGNHADQSDIEYHREIERLFGELWRGERDAYHVATCAYRLDTHAELWYTARVERDADNSGRLLASVWPIPGLPNKDLIRRWNSWPRHTLVAECATPIPMDGLLTQPGALTRSAAAFQRASWEAWVDLGGTTGVSVTRYQLAAKLGLSYRQWHRLAHDKGWLPRWPPSKLPVWTKPLSLLVAAAWGYLMLYTADIDGDGIMDFLDFFLKVVAQQRCF